MIRSICDSETASLWKKGKSRRFNNIVKVALRKLDQIDAAVQIEDLMAPPGNRLEKLKGDRAGQWSIRINDQWRICFRWNDGDAWDVEIVDYH
ncbi:MAG: excinuclease ABC subunit A [Alphaproteobacteria bacterium HGW-Alphaproteobacteria-13]|jgi:proteic killer suppression protein|nr:MAG: excinuclease ABC subunit A [Alphaproteobacteria bacterium HGW-Alphaproteobacteria-13]